MQAPLIRLHARDANVERRVGLVSTLRAFNLSLSNLSYAVRCSCPRPRDAHARQPAAAAPEPPERRSSAPNMANHTSEEHCPLSRCVTEPGYCNSEIEDDQFRALILCVCVPLLLAFLSPIVASLFSLHFRSGSCCHGDDDRPARAPLHRSAIDPPMFLGGVGLLPLECGFSGLLTIIWVMAATFVGTFFYLLNQSHPCSTALGECRTISCICGNAIPEGYVFMFSCLYASPQA